MNKKGQSEIFILLGLILGIAWMISYSIINSNPYNTYMDDCEDLYKSNFTSYNQICYSIYDINQTRGYECNKIDYSGLKSFCFEKYNEKDIKVEESK